MLALAVAVCVMLLVVTPTATSTFTDGLYTSNGTNILRVTQSDVTSVHKSDGGRIVGLAYSYSSGKMFWSDISLVNRGIYCATTDSSGKLINPRKIVSDDLLEVNGLTVDWISSHIYWTDGRRRTIEVADFNGTNRRVLVTERLSQPRAILADPVNGYLFWNDQGYHQIERSRLDGSERQIHVQNNTNIFWPNQMTVVSSKLYWVDSKHKILDSVNIVNRNERRSVSLASAVGTGHVFGLTADGGNAYISCWKSSASMIKVQLSNGSPAVYKSGLSSGAVFSNVYVSSRQQQSGTSPCAGKTCDLCLPVKATTSRCSCPSYGGKVLKNNQCVEPTNVVLYALAESGFVGFYDPTATANGDLYFVARSLRPVGVAYDPVTKNVYWSDVRERTIRRVQLDGSNALVLLDSSKGIGIVDGLVLDHVNRRLYYTNIGSVTVQYEQYSWHKVETIRLGRSPFKIRTIVSSLADRPRAIAVDSANGYLYYTDWGKTASVVRTRLDGSSPTVIRTGLNNPNGIAVVNSKIYVTDSNYKTRVPPNARTAKDGSLYSMDMNGGSWTDVLSTASTKLKTPFGLTAAIGQSLYVSDWDKRAIFAVNVSSSPATLTEVISGVALPMSLQYSPVSVSPRPTDPCSSSSCGECIRQLSNNVKCTCDSYKNGRISGNTCAEPQNYLLVSDMDGVKMVSVDSSDDKSVYVAAVGRPFSSNLVALAYDSTSETAYYSDVRSKAIYALTLSNSTSTKFYRVNHVIDGLTLHNNKLYWTDASNGLIASLDINAVAAQRQHQVLITRLDKPRSIVVTGSYVYWTEWGANPRVARMRIGSSSAETVGPSGLKWPNGLFVKEDRLYVADGHPSRSRLFNCSLPGVSNCQEITQVTSATVAHMYDIWVSSNNDLLVYSDWKSKSVNVLSFTTGTLLKPLARGLMRPSQFVFVGIPDSSPCSTPAGCAGQCARLYGRQPCVCNAGHTFNGSSSTCVAKSSLSCTHDGKSYSVGTTNISRSRCDRCQCLPNTLYASTAGLVCQAIQCPPLNCPVRPPAAGKCCPRCRVCNGVQITNCPSGDVRVSLPASQDEVIYSFSAVARDCTDKRRRITTTNKTPQGNIYQWNGATGHEITVTASVTGPVASDTCKFKIIPVDTTPPTITCPGDVLVYATDKTTVDFPAPRVTDNVGVDANMVTSQPASGSEFTVETTTPVTYTATDKAGLKRSCTFNVQVKRQSSDACVIPKLQRGHLSCSPTSSSFTCSIVCNAGYIIKPGTGLSRITCSGGQWTQQIPSDFERFTCVRIIAGTAQGSISVTANNACNGAGTLNLDYTKQVLEYRIAVNYLTYSLFDLRNVVSVSACGGGGRRRRRGVDDLIITVTISGDYQNEQRRRYISQDIEYILQKIQEDLIKGFLVVPLRNDDRIWQAAILHARDRSNVTFSCPKGSYKTDQGCILCPAGTRLSGSQCVDCEEGKYSDRDGQVECTSCPSSRSKSPAGSASINKCTPDDGLPTAVIIGVVVAVVLLIIIIIIIIVIVVCVKKRRKTPSGRDAHKHSNPAFEDNNYDTIADRDNTYEAVHDKEQEHEYKGMGDE